MLTTLKLLEIQVEIITCIRQFGMTKDITMLQRLSFIQFVVYRIKIMRFGLKKRYKETTDLFGEWTLRTYY